MSHAINVDALLRHRCKSSAKSLYLLQAKWFFVHFFDENSMRLMHHGRTTKNPNYFWWRNNDEENTQTLDKWYLVLFTLFWSQKALMIRTTTEQRSIYVLWITFRRLFLEHQNGQTGCIRLCDVRSSRNNSPNGWILFISFLIKTQCFDSIFGARTLLRLGNSAKILSPTGSTNWKTPGLVTICPRKMYRVTVVQLIN